MDYFHLEVSKTDSSKAYELALDMKAKPFSTFPKYVSGEDKVYFQYRSAEKMGRLVDALKYTDLWYEFVTIR